MRELRCRNPDACCLSRVGTSPYLQAGGEAAVFRKPHLNAGVILGMLDARVDLRYGTIHLDYREIAGFERLCRSRLFIP